jgi:hypothetical protein
MATFNPKRVNLRSGRRDAAAARRSHSLPLPIQRRAGRASAGRLTTWAAWPFASYGRAPYANVQKSMNARGGCGESSIRCVNNIPIMSLAGSV